MTQTLGFDPYAGPFGVDGIKKIIPHREPFLLVDKVLRMDHLTITASKSVRAEEDYFRGHFPGNPVMPGVLIVEAMAQTMGILTLARPEYRGKLGYFASINSARFREIVRPGDELTFHVETLKEKKRFYIGNGKAMVGDKVACEAEIMIFLAD